MPVKRAYKKRKPMFKRYRRRRYRRNYRTLQSFNTHRYITKCRLDSIVLPAASSGYTAFSYTFRLNMLPNAGELANMYDRYRLDYIKLYFVNRFNLTIYNESSILGVGGIVGIMVVDYDDATAPAASEAGMNTIREFARAKSFTYDKSRVFKIGFKPAVLTEIQRNLSTTSTSPKFGLFVDMANTDIEHYGLKGVVQIPLRSGTLPNDMFIDVYATFIYTCKDTR